MTAKERHTAPHEHISKITKVILSYPDAIPDSPEVVAQRISEQHRIVVTVRDVKKVAKWNDKTWPHERKANANKQAKIERLGRTLGCNYGNDLSKNRVRYIAAVLCQLITNLAKLNPRANALLDNQHIELLLMLRNNITIPPEMYGTVEASTTGTTQATAPAQAYSPPANGTGSLFH